VKQLDEVTTLWKQNLSSQGKDKISSRILLASENPSSFPTLKEISESLIDVDDAPVQTHEDAVVQETTANGGAVEETEDVAEVDADEAEIIENEEETETAEDSAAADADVEAEDES
jgi:hypothetical protein